MDENQILDDQHGYQLFITKEAKASLKTAATWSNFLAILGFIGVGIMVLVALFAGSFLSMMSNMRQDAAFPFPVWIFTVIYLIIAAVYFFPVLFLYRFANKTKAALASNDSEKLAESFLNLGKHYKFLGIMFIAFLALYILVALSLAVFYTSMSSSM